LLDKVVSWRHFYRARIARIYPLHLLTLLIVIPVSSGGIGALATGEGLTKLLANVTLTQSYWLNRSLYTAFNSPSWSISTELFFYLVFPLLALAVGRARRSYGRNVYWLATLVLVVPLMMLVVPEKWQHAVFYIHPLTRIAEFFLGILLFNVFKELSVSAASRHLFSWLEVGAVCLLAIFVYYSGSLPIVYRFSIFYWLPMVMLVGVFAFQKGKLSRWISHPFWQSLGEISFAFYMLHRPVMWYYKAVKRRLFSFEQVYVDLCLMLLITLVASYLVYHYFERPVGRWVKGGGGSGGYNRWRNPPPQ